MKKLKIGVIFGGMSTEHDVSIVSGASVCRNLDKEKYEVYPIYIDKDGTWYEGVDVDKEYQVGEEVESKEDSKEEIKHIIKHMQKFDVIFPVLHGLYGEDGTVQGLLELIKKPYVGCKVLGSSVAMDKVYAKIICEKAKLNQAKFVYIRKDKDEYIYVDKSFNETRYSLEEVSQKIEKILPYPMFIKPSNSGSSVGINKAKNIKELKKYIEYASQFDKKILVEEGIKGKEIECSILGNEDVKASCVGEVIPADTFYTFDAKYNNSKSRIIIPAKISDELAEEVRRVAIKAFKAIDGKGYARIDFFVDEKEKKVYISEINTIPGFTKISMYPKLWEQSGIKYSELLDELINLARE